MIPHPIPSRRIDFESIAAPRRDYSVPGTGLERQRIINALYFLQKSHPHFMVQLVSFGAPWSLPPAHLHAPSPLPKSKFTNCRQSFSSLPIRLTTTTSKLRTCPPRPVFLYRPAEVHGVAAMAATSQIEDVVRKLSTPETGTPLRPPSPLPSPPHPLCLPRPCRVS